MRNLRQRLPLSVQFGALALAYMAVAVALAAWLSRWIGNPWLAGAIGVACGAGYGILAVMATALAAIILVAVRWLEGHFKTKDEEHPSDAT